MRRKFLACLLTVAMVFTSADFTVFAAEIAEKEVVAESSDESAEQESKVDERNSVIEQEAETVLPEQEEEKCDEETSQETVEESESVTETYNDGESTEILTDVEDIIDKGSEEDLESEETVIEIVQESESETETVASEVEIIEEDVSANADDGAELLTGQCGDNLTWTIDGGTLTISGSGEMWDYNVIGENEQGRHITDVPWNEYTDIMSKLVLEEGITSIGEWAFYDCSNFDGDLTIPNTVTNIGWHAFEGCSGFTGELVIPKSIISISDGAFSDCSGFTGDLLIPNNITSIESCVFSECSGFTGDLIISDSVTNIGIGAFAGCSGFAGNLKLPNDIQRIEAHAFSRCSGFSGELIIPNSLSTIEYGVFDRCSGFTGKLTIPDSITSIEGYAFYGCSGFTGELIIPKNITTIEDNVFSGCSGFTGELVIPDNITEIREYAFSNCRGFTGVKIPENITSIENGVFSFCSGFTGELVIPENITEVGEYAFYDCNGLTESVIPESVTIIGEYAFGYCFGLEEINFLGNAPTIASDAFISVTATVYYDDTKEGWGSVINQNYGGNLTWIAYADRKVSTPVADIETDSEVESGTKVTLSCTESDAKIYYTTDGSEPTVGSTLYTEPIEISEDITIKAFAVMEGIKDSEIATFTYIIRPNYPHGKCGDNLTWKIEDGMLTISGNGEMWDYGEEVVGGYRITSAPWKEYIDTELSLVLEEGITKIGEYAFYACVGFTGELVIPESVTTIGEYAFGGCSGFTGELIIPKNITTIEKGVFYRCVGFTGELVIPESVTTIGRGAFVYCSGFTGELIIPDSVTTIGDGAFQCCSFTGELVIPESVTSIGECAFQYCSFTGELVIPESVTSIRKNAFGYCSGFTGELIIPKNITTIEEGVFQGCSGFTGELVIPENITIIENNVFSGCSGFTGELVIPESVTSIGGHAFSGCSGFTGELVIPENITTIENGVFSGCSSFTGELVIPESVTSIGEYAFRDCSGFTGELIIPKNITSIEEGAFYSCSGFTGELVIPENITEIGEYAFNGCSGFTGELVIPENITEIGACTFSGCSGLTGELVIPENITEVGINAFFGCSGLTETVIPESVTTIGEYAFGYCFGLKEINFLGNAPTIASDTFTSVTSNVYYDDTKEGWESVINQNYGGNLTWIAYSDRKVSTPVADIETDSEVENGTKVTLSCTESDAKIYYTTDGSEPTVESTLYTGPIEITEDITIKAFAVMEGIKDSEIATFTYIIRLEYPHGKCGDNLSWKIEDGTLIISGTGEMWDYGIDYYAAGNRYITSAPWGEYIDTELSLVLEEGITKIGEYAFEGCRGFTGKLVIPESVTTIGDDAFLCCSGFTGELVIPERVATIGKYAFYGCSGFTGGLVIPESVTTIGETAFHGCSGFTGELIISKNITTIENNVFNSCSGFTGELVIPESVTTIGDDAFLGCMGFTGKLVIPESVTTIGDEAFAICSGFTGELIIPESVTTIGKLAFDYCLGLEEINFMGNAPTIASNSFTSVTATVYYDNTKEGWDSVINQNYGGNLTWIAYADRKVSTPVADIETDSEVESGTKVTLSCKESDAKIYYTTDGSEPTVESTLYTEPIEITEDITIKAFAVMEGIKDSEIATFTYIIRLEYPHGKCGDNLSWKIEEGTLTISGTGEMWDYYVEWDTEKGTANGTKAPWIGHKDEIFSLVLTEGITTIGGGAFWGCSSLMGELKIPNTVETIGKYAFTICKGLTGNLKIPNSVTTIKKFAFSGCSGFTGSLIIPDSVTTIGDNAFVGCSGFTGNLIIPNNITELEPYVFGDCSGFTGNLIIPDSITIIGEYAFGGCTGFTGDIIIPDNVTTIDEWAFGGCSGFDGNIILPEGVTFIGNNTFKYCTNIKEIHFTGNAPTIESDAFTSVTSTVYYDDTKEGWESVINQNYGGTLTWIPMSERYGTLASPVSNIESGSEVEVGTKITLTCKESDAKIYYTTDGSEPTVESTLYIEPIEITRDITIKAIAVKEGFKDSEIAAFTYNILIEEESSETESSEEESSETESGEEESSETESSEEESQPEVPWEDIPEGGIPNGLWIAGIDEEGYVYTGEDIKPDIRVYDTDKCLVEGNDYTISFKNNVNVGNASNGKKAPTLIIKGKGDYSSEKSYTFSIIPVDLNDSSVWTDDIVAAYNKKQQKAVPDVIFNDKKLSDKKDFEVSYPELEDDKDAYKAVGIYDILLTGKGNFSGERTVSLIIAEGISIEKASVKIPKCNYTGEPVEPEITVSIGKTELDENTDYEVTYENNVEIGTAKAVIKGIGEYIGTKTVTFNITGYSLKKAKITNLQDKIYGVDNYEQEPVVTLNGTILIKDEDYKLSYLDTENVGKATVIITGKGAYAGEIKKKFKITAYDIGTDTNNFMGEIQTDLEAKYVKGGSKPQVILTFKGNKLIEGQDYTISYKNNKSITQDNTKNKPQLRIKGKGNFKGIIDRNFKILPRELNDVGSPISLYVPDVPYSNKKGKFISKPVLTDTDGKKLVAGKDYSKDIIYMLEDGTILTKKDKVQAGSTVKVIVNGMGAYSGLVEATYRITEKSFKNAKIKISNQEYTGKNILLEENDIKVTIKGEELRFGIDYEILEDSYINNVKNGNAKVTIVGKGIYGGSKTVKFKIVKKKF